MTGYIDSCNTMLSIRYTKCGIWTSIYTKGGLKTPRYVHDECKHCKHAPQSAVPKKIVFPIFLPSFPPPRSCRFAQRPAAVTAAASEIGRVSCMWRLAVAWAIVIVFSCIRACLSVYCICMHGFIDATACIYCHAELNEQSTETCSQGFQKHATHALLSGCFF